jgi:hypothetical protein
MGSPVFLNLPGIIFGTAATSPRLTLPEAANLHFFLKRFAEVELVLRHTRRDLAIPEECKDPVYPIEVIYGFTVFCRAVRCRPDLTTR